MALYVNTNVSYINAQRNLSSETSALTQNNIIQQASQAVLAQASQRPTIALSLSGQ